MKFVLKKIAGLIIALLIVSVLAFLAFEVIPGDPARSILGTEATESKVQAHRRYGNFLFLPGSGQRNDWG